MEGMFSSFVPYEWSRDAKGETNQLQGVLHVTVGCDSDRGTT